MQILALSIDPKGCHSPLSIILLWKYKEAGRSEKLSSGLVLVALGGQSGFFCFTAAPEAPTPPFPWVSQLGKEEVTTCQLVPSYLVTVCSPKGIFGLGLCVCVCFYMLYFYLRKDRQYIMSSVQEVTH